MDDRKRVEPSVTPIAAAKAGTVLVSVVVFLVAEFRGIFSPQKGDTLSEFVWAVIGYQTWQWAVSRGFWAGLGLWVVAHFHYPAGWGWQALLVVVAFSVAASVALWLAAGV